MKLVKTLATPGLMNLSLMTVVEMRAMNTCVALHVHSVPIVE